MLMEWMWWERAVFVLSSISFQKLWCSFHWAKKKRKWCSKLWDVWKIFFLVGDGSLLFRSLWRDTLTSRTLQRVRITLFQFLIPGVVWQELRKPTTKQQSGVQPAPKYWPWVMFTFGSKVIEDKSTVFFCSACQKENIFSRICLSGFFPSL